MEHQNDDLSDDCCRYGFFFPHPPPSETKLTGACGIAAGTPLAILGAIGQVARIGAIVKGGASLELLATVTTICLDKTGTLTLGDPHVIDVEILGERFTRNTLLAIAAAAERPSEHPVAKAILRKYGDASLPIAEDWHYEPGAERRSFVNLFLMVVCFR